MPPLAIQGSGPRRRPVAIGRPLAVHTWDENPPSFPKMREVIEIVDPDLTLVDRKLFNVLLAYSYEAIYQNAAQEFQAPAAEIRRAIGWEAHDSNTKIVASLRRLQKTIVTIGYYSEAEGLRQRNITLLVMSDVPLGEGVIRWRFSDYLAPYLGDPSQWARVHLPVMRKFSSVYALKLYELLSLYVHRRHKSWEAPVGQLRDLLGAVGKSFLNWAQFERKVVLIAVTEINAFAPFQVEYRTVKAPRSKRIDIVVFTIVQRGAVTESTRPAARQQGTLRLEHDSRTVERKRSATVDGLAAELGADLLDRLGNEYPGVDVDDAVREWTAWSIGRGEEVHSPSAAFGAWFRKNRRDGRERRGSGEVAATQLTNPDVDVVRAASWLSGQNPKRREVYLNIARSKAGKLDVPNTGVAHFGAWVPYVLDELRNEGVI
jgi:Initiator Replication protein